MSSQLFFSSRIFYPSLSLSLIYSLNPSFGLSLTPFISDSVYPSLSLTVTHFLSLFILAQFILNFVYPSFSWSLNPFISHSLYSSFFQSLTQLTPHWAYSSLILSSLGFPLIKFIPFNPLLCLSLTHFKLTQFTPYSIHPSFALLLTQDILTHLTTPSFNITKLILRLLYP